MKRTFSGFLPLRSHAVEAFAKQGFDVVAALDVGEAARAGWLEPDLTQWREWIATGGHADMHFMEENEAARRDARNILDDAQSAIVVLVPYATGSRTRGGSSEKPQNSENPTNTRFNKETPDQTQDDRNPLPPGARPLVHAVARYARGLDYHKIIKKRLDTVALSLKNNNPDFASLSWRAVVDSIPFFDRAHAREAGLGFIGKNTMLLRPGMGSFFFIATLLTNLPVEAFSEIEPESRESSLANRIANLNCGDCRACLDACPTGALPKPYFLDASRCLSYLTIEHRDVVPDAFIPHLKDTLYGCDICQEVCPYNFSTLDLVRMAELAKPRASLATQTARDLALLSQQQYEDWFGGSAMTRAKFGGLVRNALLFLHANQDPMLESILSQRRQDSNPLISKTVAQLERLRAVANKLETH